MDESNCDAPVPEHSFDADRPHGFVRFLVTLPDDVALPPGLSTIAVGDNETNTCYPKNGFLPSAFDLLPAATYNELREMCNHHQRNINTIRSCRVLMQRFSAQLNTAEELALYVRNQARVTEWRARLQQCHEVLNGRSVRDLLYATKQVAHSNAELQCQRDLYILWGTNKMTELLPLLDALSRPLESLRRSGPFRAARIDAERLTAMRQFRSDLMGELETLDCAHDAVQTKLVDLGLELFAHHFACQPNVDNLRALVDRCDAERQRMVVDIGRMNVVQSAFSDRIATAEQKLTAVRDTLDSRRLWCNQLQSEILSVTNGSIKIIMEMHWNHKAWLSDTVDFHHPTMHKVFHKDTLLAVDAMNAVLTARPELAKEFLGYVIDFMVFKIEYESMGDIMQYALKDLLLNLVFKTKRAMNECIKLPALSHLKMWAVHTIRPNRVRIGLAPTPQIQPLSALLAPVLQRYCALTRVLDDYLVMLDPDAYTLVEAAHLFRRHVICARTGRWTMYGSSRVCLPMQADGANAVIGEYEPVSVFHAWEYIQERMDDDDDLMQNLNKHCDEQRQPERACDNFRASQLRLDKTITEERSTLDHLNHLQANAFRLDRTVQRSQRMLCTLEAERRTYGELLTGGQAALRSHDEISRIHIEKQCTEIDAKQSNARIAAVCDRIQSCFRSVKTAIVDDGISADAGVDNGDNWLDEAIRTVGERRNAIKSDWREIEETWNLGIDFTDRLAKSRAALTNINRFIVMFGLQKTLTKRLLRFERDEAALLADRRMLELFDGWTAAERSQRRRQLRRTVDTDAGLRKTRRRYQQLNAQIDNELAVAEGILRMHEALYNRMLGQRRHRFGRFGEIMRTLLPLVDCSSIMPQLTLVWDALNSDPERAEAGKGTLEIVLKNGADRLMHVGRHEKRWLALMVYLDLCVVRKERSVLLVHDLLKNFSDAEMVQIVAIVKRTEILSGLQCFQVADAEAMCRYMSECL